MVLATAATDPTPIVSIFIALSASVTAGFAYRRGRKIDDKTSDLNTLREIVGSLERDREGKNAELRRMNERLDRCESEKDDLQRKVYDLQLEMYRFREKSDG